MEAWTLIAEWQNQSRNVDDQDRSRIRLLFPLLIDLDDRDKNGRIGRQWEEERERENRNDETSSYCEMLADEIDFLLFFCSTHRFAFEDRSWNLSDQYATLLISEHWSMLSQRRATTTTTASNQREKTMALIDHPLRPMNIVWFDANKGEENQKKKAKKEKG